MTISHKVTLSIDNKKPPSGGFLLSQVDFDMNFVNRLATELQYLTWVLKGEYDSAPDRS